MYVDLTIIFLAWLYIDNVNVFGLGGIKLLLRQSKYQDMLLLKHPQRAAVSM